MVKERVSQNRQTAPAARKGITSDAQAKPGCDAAALAGPSGPASGPCFDKDELEAIQYALTAFIDDYYDGWIRAKRKVDAWLANT